MTRGVRAITEGTAYAAITVIMHHTGRAPYDDYMSKVLFVFAAALILVGLAEEILFP